MTDHLYGETVDITFQLRVLREDIKRLQMRIADLQTALHLSEHLRDGFTEEAEAWRAKALHYENVLEKLEAQGKVKDWRLPS